MSAHQTSSSTDSSDLPFAPTLRKAILILFIGFATPIIVLLLIVHFISDESGPPASSPARSIAATAQRIAPVAQVTVAASAQSASAANAAATSSTAPAASNTTTAASTTPPSGNGASAAAGAAVTVASADAGKKLFESTCIACHGPGIAGAPKFGDKADWAPIIAHGLPTLYQRAIHGYTGKRGTMPPKGGSTASDADVRAAVDYMVSHSK